jgi:Kdo2-lipid IVA lauroyltransferase/acyltransferase
MTGLFKMLSVLPLWALHGLGWGLGWLSFLFSATYRKRFLANCEQAGIRSDQWTRAVGESGKLIAELPRLWMGSAVPVVWQGAEHIDQALQTGQGVLFLTPHLGCFEVTAQAYAQRFGVDHGNRGRPMTVLFRPARKAWLSDLVATSRARPGMDSAPTTLAGVKLLVRALKSGNCVGLLPDQVPPNGQGLWTPFFGRDAYTMTLSARLAQQTGAALLLAWGERLPWGRGYVVHVQPLPEPLAAALADATLQINRAMEQLVLQGAGQYLWGYDRYKQPREDKQ